MNDPRVIHMDVGCWQSYEQKEPVMTFGLIEHNTIALCTYYSNGKRLYSIPFMTKKFEYDFHKTLTRRFLDGLLIKKYGEKVIPFTGSWSMPNAKDFHIKKLIQFPPRTLLDDEYQFLIFVPDLHLHYFKLSYLDNFITWFGNDWSLRQGKPIKKKFQQRVSMERDFSTFIDYIAEFQNRYKKYNVLTKVYMLGDLTEMWETRISINNFILNKDIDRFYSALQSLTKYLRKEFQHTGKLGNLLGELEEVKLSTLPDDPIFTKQINSLKKDKESISKLYIEDDESSESMRSKAKYLENEILKKHKSSEGKDFSELLGRINWKYRIPGNHDNFGHIDSTTSLYKVCTNFSPSPQNFRSNFRSKKTDFLIVHGHNLEQYNNDEACGIGYLIVTILNLFEAKKRGDLLKKFESILTGDSNLECRKKLSPILYGWERGNVESSKKNKVVVQSHTHSPSLEDITDQYHKYKNKKIVAEQKKWLNLLYILRYLGFG